MVDRILEATSVCIERNGLQALTTNHVADEAGISVASLYRYFENKHELVKALIERLTRDATMRVSRNFLANQSRIDARSLTHVTRSGLQLIFAFIRENPVYCELLKNWQSLPVNDATAYLEGYFTDYCRDYFSRHFVQYPVNDLRPRLYVLINSVLFLVVRYLSTDHPPVTEADLVETLTKMMVLLMEEGAQRIEVPSPL